MKHKFVEFIPEILEPGVLYISIKYSTAVHACVCGCGNEVVTPIAPTDWSLTFHGDSVSLHPSIGNWSFDCQSHYWIKKGQVTHCRKWDNSKVDAGRKKDKKTKRRKFRKRWIIF
ncbi:MAG: DUF6527 family protein [bacterium]|nr:DUF6527 family protein [bacterium]